MACSVHPEAAYILQVRHRAFEYRQTAGGLSFDQRLEGLAEEIRQLGEATVFLRASQKFIIERYGRSHELLVTPLRRSN
jgi:hypothetical protein